MSKSIPDGKRLHIQCVLLPQNNFPDPLGQPGDPIVVDPLLSQPIVEQCLRTPTYVLADGGLDRGLARRAFAEDVPKEIIARYWKGGAVHFANEVLAQNIAFIRELLLDGLMVRERILDRAKVEEALSGRVTRNDVQITEIFSHVVTEAWLKTWCRTSQSTIPQIHGATVV